jgi:hypothetical protein
VRANTAILKKKQSSSVKAERKSYAAENFASSMNSQKKDLFPTNLRKIRWNNDLQQNRAAILLQKV